MITSVNSSTDRGLVEGNMARVPRARACLPRVGAVACLAFMRALALIALVLAPWASPAQGRLTRSVRIADLPWTEARSLLDSSIVVVIPIGAEAKEHGPHLPLNNDFLLAEQLTRRVFAATPIVLYPTLNYHFYPSFVDYAGSTTVRLETARDLVVDIVRTIARHGPRRFYLLNTGVSTLRALRPAQEILTAEGLVVRHTDILAVAKEAEDRIRQQAGGTHADEIETSIALYLYPEKARMALARDDYHPGTAGGLSPDSATAAREGRTWSATGIFGNATLATREKGQVMVDAIIGGMLREIDALRRTAIPSVRR